VSAQKKSMLTGKLTAEEKRRAYESVRTGMLSTAIAWFVRRAQQIGADPMPLLLRDGGLDSLHSTWGWSDEMSADVLRNYGLIPRKRKTGPKETFRQRVEREYLLRKFKFELRGARAIHRQVSRKLTTADEISRASCPTNPRAWRELSAIVAEYRKPSASKETSLAALVAAYVFGLAPKAALRRLDTLSKRTKRRTNSTG